MRDNKGITLVELLIALAIASVIMTAVSSMILSAVRMYAKGSTNVELQNEAQTTFALLTDSVMEANGLKVVEADTIQTEYALLGEMKEIEIAGIPKIQYLGKIILNYDNPIKGYREIYIASYQEADSVNIGNTQAEVENAIKADVMNHKERYLLSAYVTRFYMDITDKAAKMEDGTDKFSVVEKIFHNPISVEITMEWKKNAGMGDSVRSVSDRVKIRNKAEKIILENVWDTSGTIDMSGEYTVKK